jgi:hypothetical protein
VSHDEISGRPATAAPYSRARHKKNAPSRAPLKDRGADLYETPAVAVEALLRVEKLPVAIWEPACGPGAIVRVLRAAGHVVWATDVNDYKSPDQDASGWDFLMERQVPIGVEAIVTNPPFKLAGDFIAHALDLVPRVVMLLRLTYYEGSGLARAPLDAGALARIHVFRNRLPRMHRAGWTGKKASSSTAFAWYVWDASHTGPTVIDRITWEDSK